MDQKSAYTAPPKPPVPVREIGVFIALAYSLAWLAYLPVLIGGEGIESPMYGVSAQILMITPSVATLTVLLLVNRPTSIPRATGMWPVQPVRRVGGYCLLALALFPLMGLLATLAATALGVIRLDLSDFSGLRVVLADLSSAAAGRMPAAGFPAQEFLLALAMVLLTSFLPSLVLMFGEEWGWRGYLLTRLLPIGVWPALLITGAVWGLWHSPQLLILATTGGMGPGGIAVFLAFCVISGVVIGWLRLASGSVWPAVVAHGANNTLAIIAFLTLSDAESPTHPFLYSGGAGGIVGIVLLLVLVALLAVGRQFRVRPFDPVFTRPPTAMVPESGVSKPTFPEIQ